MLVMVILHIRSKKKKKLTCILFPSLSLVDIRTEVKDRIKIYYDEELVENLSMTKVKIKNNGNLPIRRKDIVKPLEFKFGENLNIIDSSVINIEPEGITLKLESNKENNLIRCVFDLLNSGDELTLQFVCLGESKELPNIIARIEGIKQIDVVPIPVSEEEIERIKKHGKWFVSAGLTIFPLGWVIFFISLYLGDPWFFLAQAVISFGAMLIILGIMTKMQFKF